MNGLVVLHDKNGTVIPEVRGYAEKERERERERERDRERERERVREREKEREMRQCGWK